MLPQEEAPWTLADRLIVGGALAFLVGVAAASFLYAKDPYGLTLALYTVPPSTAWPFYAATGGLISLSLGGGLAWWRG